MNNGSLSKRRPSNSSSSGSRCIGRARVRIEGPTCCQNCIRNRVAIWGSTTIIGSCAIWFRNGRRHIPVILPKTARSSDCGSSVFPRGINIVPFGNSQIFRFTQDPIRQRHRPVSFVRKRPPVGRNTSISSETDRQCRRQCQNTVGQSQFMRF
jgi:hypothetical protein